MATGHATLATRSVVSASRPFIEEHIRRRTRALANVTIETGVHVDGLAHEGGRVRGVHMVQDDARRRLDADLVVDCSGRASNAGHWLADIGYPRTDR